MTASENEGPELLGHHDPATPLADLPPVELIEVDGDGVEPPESWGQNGQGGDDEPTDEGGQADEPADQPVQDGGA